MMVVQMVNQAVRLGRRSGSGDQQLEELINRGIIDQQGLQMAHSITGMTDAHMDHHQ